jgi:hypothetical protein
MVHDGVTAFLAKEGDVHPLAYGMERLLCNPNETARMGLAASSFARRRFTFHHHVAAVIAAVYGPVEQQESNSRILLSQMHQRDAVGHSSAKFFDGRAWHAAS